MNNLVKTNVNGLIKELNNIPIKEIVDKYWWVPAISVSLLSLADNVMENGYKLHLKVKDYFEFDLIPRDDETSVTNS